LQSAWHPVPPAHCHLNVVLKTSCISFKFAYKDRKKTYKIDSYSKKISPWDNNYLKDLQICFKHLPSTGNINV
ncbi:hypothetical protein LI317_28260, partial [Bacteroides thetaiotaomicron]|uniref:hypothetical protein n=1 Tax=Bacteroides thetaiotaomicron TaxID=818 RepID=UPI001D090A15